MLIVSWKRSQMVNFALLTLSSLSAAHAFIWASGITVKYRYYKTAVLLFSANTLSYLANLILLLYCRWKHKGFELWLAEKWLSRNWKRMQNRTKEALFSRTTSAADFQGMGNGTPLSSSSWWPSWWWRRWSTPSWRRPRSTTSCWSSRWQWMSSPPPHSKLSFLLFDFTFGQEFHSASADSRTRKGFWVLSSMAICRSRCGSYLGRSRCPATRKRWGGGRFGEVGFGWFRIS